jgi:hypothetical protein
VSSPAKGGHPGRNALREVPATVKAAWDALLDPGPRYLGRPERGIERALGDRDPHRRSTSSGTASVPETPSGLGPVPVPVPVPAPDDGREGCAIRRHQESAIVPCR